MRYYLLIFFFIIFGAANNSFSANRDESYVSPFQGTYDRAENYWLENIGSKPNNNTHSSILYFLGNVTNTMFHEFGHALISEFEIPVLGREEDAVDSFANIMMISEDPDPILDEMIVAVSDEYFEEGKFSELVAWDEHSMNEQRAYAVVCMLVGADPVGFKHAADNASMPKDRQEACAFEWEKTSVSWNKLLEEHYLSDKEKHSPKIIVKYQKPGEKYVKVAGLLEASGIIEDVVEYIGVTYKIPNDIIVSVKRCGEENAFWEPDGHKLTMCYELADKYLASAITTQSASNK
ncbi:MAG: DUF4344 domain-containing metallopeptidase [Beijerinckiaceae bacterium]|nr:DUF4344 domain-containing metallopeptidase [Beijerinckiaceae bacterium]